MSHDLVVWDGERPLDNHQAGSVYDELCARYLESDDVVVSPTPRIAAYIEALVERYPDDIDGSAVWASPPVIDEASGRVLAVVPGWQSGTMRPWNTSTEDGLRKLLNEWDPIGVAGDVQDEYDCMLAPLLQLLRSGADQTEIGEFLRHELEDHFGLDPLGLRPEAMAVRVIGWWAPTGPAADVARA